MAKEVDGRTSAFTRLTKPLLTWAKQIYRFPWSADRGIGIFCVLLANARAAITNASTLAANASTLIENAPTFAENASPLMRL